MEKKKIMIIGGIAVVIAAIAVYLWYKSNNKLKPSATTTEPTIAPTTSGNVHLANPAQQQAATATETAKLLADQSQPVGNLYVPQYIQLSANTQIAPGAGQNNWVVAALTVAYYMNKAGNVADANTITSQVAGAWNLAGTPNYNDGNVLATYGTLPRGQFAAPWINSVINGGQDEQLANAYQNAIILMATAAMNYVQTLDSGQSIGSRQSIIRNEYINAKNNVFNLSTVPENTAALIVTFTYATTNVWPVGGGGGSQDPQATQQVIAQSVAIAGIAAKIIALA